jgi:hypothetical protein
MRPQLRLGFSLGAQALLQNMSGMPTLSLHHDQRAHCSRALTYLLLVLVGYGSTVVLAHRHRGLSPKTSRPTAVSTTTSSLAAKDATTSSTDGPIKSCDCLVCQFQHSLSSAAISRPRPVLAQTASASIIRVLGVSFLSHTRSTGQGRAPPVSC